MAWRGGVVVWCALRARGATERTHPTGTPTQAGAQATADNRTGHPPPRRAGRDPRRDRRGAGSYHTAGVGGLLAHPQTTSSRQRGISLTGAAACYPCPKQWTGLRLKVVLCGSLTLAGCGVSPLTLALARASLCHACAMSCDVAWRESQLKDGRLS